MPRRRSLPLDPEKSAVLAGLRYTCDHEHGITRVRHGRGFGYLDADGRPVRDPAVLARIRSLVIPPAWRKVWICPDPNGHLQALGYDVRGRRQYRYHAVYRTIRNETKFHRLADVAEGVARAREVVKRHLGLPEMPREKVLAAAVRLLDTTAIRVGNEESASEFQTFGLTTLLNKHVEIAGAKLRFRFKGKSGVQHEVEIADRRLARVIRECQDLPGQQLFEYVDDEGNLRTVSSTDVNAYLREISGQILTAKDFRTWVGTVECAVALRDIGGFSSEAEAKRNIVAAIKTAAQRLGNRVATCRNYYVNPAILESYMAGTLLSAMQNTQGGMGDTALSAAECAVLAIIRRQPHSAKVEELIMPAAGAA